MRKLERILISCIAFSLLLSVIPSASQSMLQVQEEKGTNILDYSFEKPIIADGFKEPYKLITIPGLTNHAFPGEPVIPFKTARILIPHDEEIQDIQVISGNKIYLGKFYLQPAQEAFPLSYRGKIEETPPNEVIYNSKEPYPENLYSKVGIQQKRGYQILILNLYPIEYNPKSMDLSYFDSFKVVVKTKKAGIREESLFRGLSQDRGLLYTIVDNPEVIRTYDFEVKMQRSSPLLQGQCDYVIITNDELKNAPRPYNFQALADWKNSRGITTTIVTVEEIYANYSGVDNQTKIRDFIRDAYLNNGITYVLLGGDADGADVGGESGDNIVPVRGLWAWDHETDPPNIPSDLYYACLDGTYDYDGDGTYGEPNDGPAGGEVDLMAEVYVGRAPVDSASELSNFVRKTINYESSSNAPYLRDVWMVGELLWSGGGDGDCFVEEAVYKGNVANPEETLNPLRELRDEALKKEYVNLYYEYSPDVKKILIEEPGLLIDTAKLIVKYKPGVKYVIEKETGEDLQINEKDIEQLISYIKRLESEIIEREKEIGVKRSSVIIELLKEFEEQIKASEGLTFSQALQSSIYFDDSGAKLGGELSGETWGGDYKDEVANGSCAHGYCTVGFPPTYNTSMLYDRDYPGHDWPNSEIISIINNNTHIINHLGHSDVNYVMKMYNSDADTLTNNKYFFGYSQGCYAGSFDNRDDNGNYLSYDSVVEHLVTNPTGAFGFIANSRYGWGEKGSTDGPSQHYDRQFWDAVFGENIANIGKALQDSKEDNIGSVSSGVMRFCYYEINLLGDPETSIQVFRPEHDLAALIDAPSFVEPNEEININATIFNYGNNIENNIQVQFLVDGTLTDTQIILSLPVGSSTNVNFIWSSSIEGQYNLSIHAVPVLGEDHTANNIVSQSLSIVALAEAVDNTNLSLSTGGDSTWANDTSTYWYDEDSARSGNISNNQDTWMQTTVQGPGLLSFYWKVSSESGYDFLRFYIDAEQQDRISGEADWQEKTYSLSSGNHTMSWVYEKDGSVSRGSDCGWVDKVVISAFPSFPELAEAVDNTNLSLATYGDALWINDTSTYWYDGDSARSGNISNNQNTRMQTTVQGPGLLSFHWKVSSESGYDFLRFYIDAEQQDRISGEVDWQEKTYSLSSGNHTIKWGYTKDYSVSRGSDCGWVDKVVISAFPSSSELAEAVDNTNLSLGTCGDALWINDTSTYWYDGDSARSGNISNNQDTWMQTTVQGPGLLSFYWKVSSESGYDFLRFYIDAEQQDRISGEVDWQEKTYSLSSGNHTMSWIYEKDGSVSRGSDCGWVDKVVISAFPSFPELAEAVDNTNLSLSTGGDSTWANDTSTYWYDEDSARSGNISNNQDTWMQTTVQGPGLLSFYWKVSSESGYDFLRFYIDAEQQDRISGEVDWQEKTYSLSSGNHTISWVYEKDGSVSRGSDCGWVDKIVITPINILPTASFIYTPSNPIVNQTITFNASESYDPDGNITNYKWNFGEGNITNTTEPIITHSYSQVGTYTVTLTVTDNEGAIDATSQNVTVNIAEPSIPTISIGNISAVPNYTTPKPIIITNVDDLGYIDVNLTYDPSVARVIGATGTPFDMTTNNLQNSASGWVRISGMQTIGSGLNSPITLSTLTFEAVGNEGDSTPLNIVIESMGYSNATPITTYMVNNGTFTIRPPAYNISISTDSPKKITTKNINATYMITLKNTGEITDNYTLSVTNTNGAAVANLSVDSIANLAVGAAETVLLNVTDDDTFGTYNVTVNVISQNEPSKSDNVTVMTTVAPSISIGDITAATNGEATGAIIIKYVDDVGTADVTLTYNPNVVQVISATDTPFDATTNNLLNNASGWVRIAGMQMVAVGLNSPITLCTLTFKAVGNEGGSTPLTLSVNSMAYSNATLITTYVDNGIFTVLPGEKGDVDGNPGVTMIDAMYLAKHVVGLPGFETIDEYAAGVDGNPGVTMIDAMYLAKHVVGLPGFEVLQ